MLMHSEWFHVYNAVKNFSIAEWCREKQFQSTAITVYGRECTSTPEATSSVRGHGKRKCDDTDDTQKLSRSLRDHTCIFLHNHSGEIVDAEEFLSRNTEIAHKLRTMVFEKKTDNDSWFEIFYSWQPFFKLNSDIPSFSNMDIIIDLRAHPNPNSEAVNHVLGIDVPSTVSSTALSSQRSIKAESFASHVFQLQSKTSGTIDSDGWIWFNKTLLLFNHREMLLPNFHTSEHKIIPRVKIAAFDFDGTLAHTSLFRKGVDAWSLKFPNIPNIFRHLSSKGFMVCVLTNQGTIGKAKASRDREVIEKKGRLTGFCNYVDIPMFIGVATGAPKQNDIYRKPNPGMWHFLEELLALNGALVDREKSFYVGDAAGRKKDHSDSDRCFAEALSVPFYTETDFFAPDGSHCKHI